MENILNTNNNELVNEMDERECNLDDDVDDERYTAKNIKDGFVHNLRDFSSFNPSGNKGKEKMNNSMMMMPSAIK